MFLQVSESCRAFQRAQKVSDMCQIVSERKYQQVSEALQTGSDMFQKALSAFWRVSERFGKFQKVSEMLRKGSDVVSANFRNVSEMFQKVS
jgi:hypothetical protein